MANGEHLAVLGRGVEVWNAWRGEIRDVRPDLRGANLTADESGANLAADEDFRNPAAEVTRFNLPDHDADLFDLHDFRADFSGASFSGANLLGANLIEADLREADLHDACLIADLRGAALIGANLSSADLRGADLRGASLHDADLRDASLSHANLIRADLRGANFTRTSLLGTVFANVDLSEAKGLDACIHRGPSIIDHHTLQRSGQLPLDFVRGCGLNDWEIEATKLYQRNLSQDKIIEIVYELARIRGEQPIQFYSAFISYSSLDDDFAQRLYADLQNEGIRCWFAPEDMKIGDRIRTRIDDVIWLYEKLLLVLSENSIDSNWVEKEVETAFEKERETKSTVLFPVRLDAAVMESKTGWAADIKRTRHIGDLTDWKDHDAYQKGLKRLLLDLTIDREAAARTVK